MHEVSVRGIRVLAWLVFACGVGQSAPGQVSPGDTSSTNAAAPPPQVSTSPYVAAKSGDVQIWESVRAATNALGRVTVSTNRLAEIATGERYNDSGEWKPSEPAFTEQIDGFVASKVQARLTLQRDLNVGGAVHITTPDQKEIYSTPVAITLFEPATSALLVLGEITNCAGTLVNSNLVVFDQPFADGSGRRLCGSLVVTVTKTGIEQDYVWTANLSPQAYGFSSNCWVQVISEIQSGPQPDIIERPIYIEQDEGKRQQSQNPDFIDHTIGWGEFVLSAGKCYVIGEDGQTMVPISDVAKELRTETNRWLLVESVPYSAIAADLAKLGDCAPQGGGHAQAAPGNALKRSYAAIASPPKTAKIAGAAQKRPETAKVTRRPSGVSIDYIGSIGGGLSGSVVFSSSTNWLVTGPVTCNGAATIEAGAIFRYKTNSSILLNNTLTLRGVQQYRPIIFSALDDTSLGDSITTNIAASFTGVINTNGYANPALNLVNSATLSNCRFLYAKVAVQNSVASAVTLTVNHSQFVNCMKGVSLTLSGSGSGGSPVTLNLNNVLMTGVATNVVLPSTAGSVCTLINCTLDQSARFFGSGSGTIQSTNSIFANVTALGATLAGDHNGFFNAPQFGVNTFTNSTSPFQTVGGSSYYLSDSSGFRNVGTTTGVSSSLLNDLKLRTTYPPNVVTNAIISTDVALWPEVPRDIDSLDLGWHADPLDVSFSGVYVSNAVLTVNPGTAIGTFAANGATNGLVIGNNAQFLCNGSPKQPVWIAQFNTVQEGTTTNWQRTTGSSLATDPQSVATSPVIGCRFTDFSMLSLDGYQFRASTNTGPLNFRDCEFHGGLILSSWPTLNFTNVLFERVETDIQPGDNLTSYFRNNLFYGGKFGYGPTNAVIYDNLFDQAAIPDWIGGRGNFFTGGYNAYITNCSLLQPTNTSDIRLATNAVAYKSGALGNYYQATNSPLHDAGSTAASSVSLYHYTVSTNLVSGTQIKEGSSTVDQGLHYAALDSGGNVIDTDGDSLFDVFEDANNNGSVDSGETDWQNSENGTTGVAGLVVFTFLE